MDFKGAKVVLLMLKGMSFKDYNVEVGSMLLLGEGFLWQLATGLQTNVETNPFLLGYFLLGVLVGFLSGVY